MTERIGENEWRTATDPFVLLDALFPMRSPDSVEPQARASRLYLLACARRAWVSLPWVCRALVEVAEKIVDGEALNDALRSAASYAAEELTHCQGDLEVVAELEELLCHAGLSRPQDGRPEVWFDSKTWNGLAHLVYYPFAAQTPNFRHIPREYHSPRLIRELFSHPRRGAALLPPAWRTSTVMALARGMYQVRDYAVADSIYQTRDFSPMPILADALMDAGCDDQEILDHCRNAQGHVRGCWVIERILKG